MTQPTIKFKKLHESAEAAEEKEAHFACLAKMATLRAEAAEELSGKRYMATCEWAQKAEDAQARLRELVRRVREWNRRGISPASAVDRYPLLSDILAEFDE